MCCICSDVNAKVDFILQIFWYFEIKENRAKDSILVLSVTRWPPYSIRAGWPLHITQHNTHYNTLHITQHNTIQYITHYTTQYNIGSEPVHCPGCRSFWFARTCELGHRRSWEKLQKRICFRKFIAAPINWYYVPRTFKNTVLPGFIDKLVLLFLTSFFGCFLNPEFSWYKETHQRECVVSLRGNINVQEECRL